MQSTAIEHLLVVAGAFPRPPHRNNQSIGNDQALLVVEVLLLVAYRPASSNQAAAKHNAKHTAVHASLIALRLADGIGYSI